MGRRCKGDALRLDRSWVWTADAERRWLRAFRLLLTPDAAAARRTAEQLVTDLLRTVPVPRGR